MCGWSMSPKRCWPASAHSLALKGESGLSREQFRSRSLRGEISLELGRPRIKEAKPRHRRKTQIDMSAVDEMFFEELGDLRQRHADHADVPPYVVFSDATQAKLERYGRFFLDAIDEHRNRM